MMYPRLKLLHRLLAEDGSIWISIDDNEMPSLRLVLDEIFGRSQFIAANVWQKRYSRENREAIGDVHEYVVVYAKNPQKFKILRNRLPLDENQAKVYRNPENPRETDPAKRWRGLPISAQGFRANQMYKIVSPNGHEHFPPEGRCWSMIESEFQKLRDQGRIYWGKDGNAQPSVIRFLSEVDGFVPWTWWPHDEVGHTDESRKEIQAIFGTQTAFDTPKPVRLMERVFQIATNPGDIILDSFAGSGTTAHAVLKLNSRDEGNRRFILVEAMDYAETITAERTRRVISGYNDGNSAVAGLGGSFDFYTVGERLLQEDGLLNPAVGLPAIRDYVAWTEGIPIGQCAPLEPKTNDEKQHSPYWMGETNGLGVFFVWDHSRATTLDLALLTQLVKQPGRYVIYADQCALSEEFMRRHNIVYKKIPRDITRF